MEYAMLTLIGRERSFESLVGVTSHELAHSWFQHALATNEMKHEWMDEGFTSYISDLAENEVLQKNLVFPHAGSYRSYMRLALSGFEQPQSTNANRYVDIIGVSANLTEFMPPLSVVFSISGVLARATK